MLAIGVVEPIAVKEQIIKSATEAACMILRIIHAASVADYIICSLTTIGSTTSIDNISAILVFLASIPVHLRP